MPSKSHTLPDGVNRLSKLVAHLNASPKPTLQGVRSLRVCLASKHDHVGAKTFVQEELPRIRFANPDIGIEVKRALTTRTAPFRATMNIEHTDGTKKEFNLQGKSSLILQELMDTAGGEAWKRYKATATKEGKGVSGPRKNTTSESTKKLPTLDEWQKMQAELKKKAKETKPTPKPKNDAPSTPAPKTKAKETTAKGNKVKESSAKGTKVKGSSAKENKLKGSGAKETKAKGSNAKDKKAKDTPSKSAQKPRSS